MWKIPLLMGIPMSRIRLWAVEKTKRAKQNPGRRKAPNEPQGKKQSPLRQIKKIESNLHDLKWHLRICCRWWWCT
jgi:hypothetical protein